MSFPIWRDWELEFIPHIEKRMFQRGLTETELRAMLFNVNSIEKDKEKGRYLIKSKHYGNNWEIIVEPDLDEKLVVVITAYPIEE
jgi:hypothetical protein